MVKIFLCARCASMRFVLTDMEDGMIEAKCAVCDWKIILKKPEPKTGD